MKAYNIHIMARITTLEEDARGRRAEGQDTVAERRSVSVEISEQQLDALLMDRSSAVHLLTARAFEDLHHGVSDAI